MASLVIQLGIPIVNRFPDQNSDSKHVSRCGGVNTEVKKTGVIETGLNVTRVDK